ncbi:MAG: ATP-dependent DNA ligase [Acidimicrobiales bacterium]
MNLPVNPPVKPMLARLVRGIPTGMAYEPKFDGFRCISFRDGDEVELGSRNTRPLDRYFPELVSAFRRQFPYRSVVDGEIVVALGGRLDFEALQQRIHPAASRVALLARETPASFIAFDLLALGDLSLLDRPLAERRKTLESALAEVREPIFLSPVTTSVEVAEEWFRLFEGAGIDGILAKPHHIKYVQDKRVMFKVKHERTAECVVAGFRRHKSGAGVGSLLLGLYDGTGMLHHMGVAASFSEPSRRRLVEELAPYRLGPGEPHPWAPSGSFDRAPGGEPSRWSRDRNLVWEPLQPALVAEVAYDYLEGDRFRHVTHFQRWRHDRDPGSCLLAQLEEPPPFDLAEVLPGIRGER